MLTPTVLRPLHPLHGVGSRPAVNLTQSVPQGVDADILLLESGDVRHILYTAYHENGLREFSALIHTEYQLTMPPATRKLDITSCEVEDATVGMFTFKTTIRDVSDCFQLVMCSS